MDLPSSVDWFESGAVPRMPRSAAACEPFSAVTVSVPAPAELSLIRSAAALASRTTLRRASAWLIASRTSCTVVRPLRSMSTGVPSVSVRRTSLLPSVMAVPFSVAPLPV